MRRRCANGSCIRPEHLFLELRADPVFIIQKRNRQMCSEKGCRRPHYARGLCGPCYKRHRAHGTIKKHNRTKAAPGMTLDERLRNIGWTVIRGCWLWNGAKTTAGYGQLATGLRVGDHYRPLMAARAAYEAWIGPIPDSSYIVPKCGSPSYIRPEHLWAKPKQMFYMDNQAEGMASRYVHDEARPRRYRLTEVQIREVDGRVRRARLAFMSGSLSKAEFDHEMLRVEKLLELLTHGCAEPDVGRIVGPPVPQQRRWFTEGSPRSDGLIIGPVQRRKPPGLWPRKPA